MRFTPIWLRIVLFAAGGFVLGLAAVAVFLVARFEPMARDYFIATLQTRYQSTVELGSLQISLFPAVHATGENLTMWFRGNHDGPPMVQIRRFTLDTAFVSFFRAPRHIGHLRLGGLQIHPPRRSDTYSVGGSSNSGDNAPAFILDEIVADGATLEITPNDPSKNSLIFEIPRLTLKTVGRGQPMTFHAEVSNPKPAGMIHSDGQFGPWNAGRPVDTPISGEYKFLHADLSVFKGIAGTLTSEGRYQGLLDRIEVQGVTETPDFALHIGGHPMVLHTDFQATVDGTNGNTVLHPVHARLARSQFYVTGSIERSSLETHKTILLHAAAIEPDSTRLEDFLRLAVKSAAPPMTGSLGFETDVKIPPGSGDVIDRLELDGNFHLGGVRFSSADVQGKIAALSHRAEGRPDNHDPNVAADFHGAFHLRGGNLGLPDLNFTVPGAQVSLTGNYVLRSGVVDMRGNAKLDATVSQMTTGFASKLLKPLDPFFSRGTSGTVLPIVIRGTRGEPSFRLDIGQMFRH